MRDASSQASGGCRSGFGARFRLSGRGVFERLLKEGARRNLAGYTFFLVRRDSGPPRLGILISRKHARKATTRNWIKRCIREAFRTEQSAIGSIDVLVRPPIHVVPGNEMIARLRGLLVRLST